MNRRAAATRTCATLIAVCATAAIAQPPCADPEYHHGISYVSPRPQTEPPPYLRRAEFGRSLIYERVPGYWAKT